MQVSIREGEQLLCLCVLLFARVGLMVSYWERLHQLRSYLIMNSSSDLQERGAGLPPRLITGICLMAAFRECRLRMSSIDTLLCIPAVCTPWVVHSLHYLLSTVCTHNWHPSVYSPQCALPDVQYALPAVRSSCNVHFFAVHSFCDAILAVWSSCSVHCPQWAFFALCIAHSVYSMHYTVLGSMHTLQCSAIRSISRCGGPGCPNEISTLNDRMT